MIWGRENCKNGREKNYNGVDAGLYMALKHCISLVIDSAANFGCNQFRIMPDSFCVPPSEIDVLFDGNLSRRFYL